MEEKYYIAFLEKYLENRQTDEEHRLFVKWFGSIPVDEAQKVMDHYVRIGGTMPFLSQPETYFSLIRNIEERLDTIDQREYDKPEYGFSFWGYSRRFAAAAVFLLIGAASYYLFFIKTDIQKTILPRALSYDAAPGGNKAMLTLSDGSTINLNDANDGEIAKQAGTRINKVTDGHLVYAGQINPDKDPIHAVDMNLVRTPKAGQYRISLSDGTKVWLNSLSSIRFPAAFTGSTRKVEITGEAYFEVTGYKIDGKKIPFHVLCNNQLIEVVGTHFNVNSYKDEAVVKTTLLEGSVKVSTIQGANGKPETTVKLKPGQQSIVKLSGEIAPIQVEKADTESAIAWKEGYFKFKDTDIQEVMRQLSRWYDLDVAYIGALPKDQFTGYVSKKVSISNVLNILEEGGGVKFSIKEKKVEVSALE